MLDLITFTCDIFHLFWVNAKVGMIVLGREWILLQAPFNVICPQDSLSAADVVIWAALHPATTKYSGILNNYQHIQKWFQVITSHDACQQAVAKVTGGQGSSAFKTSILAQPIVAAPKEVNEKRASGGSASTKSDSPSEVCREWFGSW